MRIGGGAAMAGEMLGGANNTTGAGSVDHRHNLFGDLVGIAAEAAGGHRAVGVVGDIRNRRKVHVDSVLPEKCCPFLREDLDFAIGKRPHRHGTGSGITSQSRDRAAFLIDADEWRNEGVTAVNAGDECRELGCGANVRADDQDPARQHAFKIGEVPRRHDHASGLEEEHLADALPQGHLLEHAARLGLGGKGTIKRGRQCRD